MKISTRHILILLVSALLIGCMTKPHNATPLPKHQFMRNAQQQVAFEIDTLLNHAPTDMGWWGVKVQYANTGEVIYERNSDRMFTPASNMKMYTTAAALCLLGPQYRYETDFVTNGSIDKGVLNGDLIIRGSGDPTWSRRFYDENYDSVMVRFVDSLKAKGITEINGNIVGDDNVFDDVPLGDGWSWGYEHHWYAAQISGLSYSENIIDFTLTPDINNIGGPVIIEFHPQTSYLNLRNDLITVSHKTTQGWRHGRIRETNNGWFEGEYSISDGTQEEDLTINNPTLFTVFALKKHLIDKDINVVGEPVDVDDLPDAIDYEQTSTLFTYFSHPMSSIIKGVNRRSINFIAEQVHKTLGKEFGAKGSADEGGKIQIALFDSLGMDTKNLHIRDGSGLSNYNLVSPNTTTSLLQMMWNHPYRSYYLESFSLTGVSGATRKRLRGTSAEGNVRTKTGTIAKVRTLSGYTWTQSGEPIIFSILVNHHVVPNSQVNQIQDQIVVILSDME
ncbi:MAG: D-alanyl-D-alanine carboxypeptidase/D-alanyl-D-alanine-endopeptidase [Candidatus Marinimicrobia bacterium]|nr:D-alanyl-D-alanine carboxypeptidase/D-alanyl-D-alanine-endopeptidase [Candidatus Neomarinimicrobiota bacterium]MBT4361498.1 D-alanyl-D-alanine carboxypeptidase/D-alanyl-D-alanine-endopeptidase [Candidatus Neomarinimicrobiota bacterium]MBT4713936.1 D-alanyl-D-alanine carboxypeptidase/D-alanyl-D-alanine-endopeptidase [Candidatus Neomarinimicrobiota bacterium]MBT4946465.1 D-alanyl-D-alanine carboxypeptidase/D-alanyl-D-alanine-endopeptidase [Candidatus Neomarinimicrobiota bacterium]MBT5269543.1 